MIKVDPQCLGREVVLGTFAVTAQDIRTFAEAVGDRNPLYLDPAAAQEAGYADVIAPPLFCLQLRGDRRVPEVEIAPGFVTLNGGQELEFYDDLCAGQTYTATAKLAEVYEKTGRSGPLGVIVREVAIKSAEGRTVVRMRERQMIRSPEKKL
ncbi:MAG TPA: MaoC family dehydratase N-terminal domain-containing protein [Candidatus Binatia bacterium]|jgi:acyl dehydratase|nr:MaoC family dehydratase N-terminal domain-containing protein [Candidatus Binatia bacterium]